LNDQVTIFVAFLAGTFSFLSPCVLPLFPSYLSFITGMSFEDLTAERSRSLRPVVKNSSLFIFGFSTVFTAMGASAGFLGGMLFTYRNTLQLLGGILVIFFGLYIMGVLKLPLLGRYLQLNIRNRPAAVFGSLLIGASFAIGWTPCVGPILGAILTLAASTGGTNTGILLLSSYSLGLAVPFFHFVSGR
jgi:cytochrome c-type biogenesis protein